MTDYPPLFMMASAKKDSIKRKCLQDQGIVKAKRRRMRQRNITDFFIPDVGLCRELNRMQLSEGKRKVETTENKIWKQQTLDECLNFPLTKRPNYPDRPSLLETVRSGLSHSPENRFPRFDLYQLQKTIGASDMPNYVEPSLVMERPGPTPQPDVFNQTSDLTYIDDEERLAILENLQLSPERNVETQEDNTQQRPQPRNLFSFDLLSQSRIMNEGFEILEGSDNNRSVFDIFA